jgi:bifunctional DNase/RNase
MANRAPPRISSPLAAAIATALALGMAGCDRAASDSTRSVQVHVDRVAIDTNNVPVLVLEEDEGSRWLPIWIGTSEARSIALEMEERSSPRPNTHDLARNVIYGLEGDLERVTVTELKGGTYFATMALRVRKRLIEIDSRPSDAIAIALRTDAPIFVRESVFEAADAPPELEEEALIAPDSGREI